MRKNFDMDAAIRRALRESIEAHAHEWEPGFKTGVGPVGDDAPFDNKVSESCDKEDGCCPKCGKCPCECKKEEGDMNEGLGDKLRGAVQGFKQGKQNLDWNETGSRGNGNRYMTLKNAIDDALAALNGNDIQLAKSKLIGALNLAKQDDVMNAPGTMAPYNMNEGTIPGDSHEWEPDFKTGVGEVGDDSPFTQAVNEALTDTRDWEDGSFGASEPKKEGIAYADGAEECDNGVVATSQKNSGEVVSKDNISENAGEEQKNEDDVIKEERDRFFNILNRIEKLHD